MSDLLNCPFCGGEAELRWHNSDCYVVGCSKCAAEGPPVGTDNPSEVAAQWNTRAPAPSQPVQPEAAPVEPVAWALYFGPNAEFNEVEFAYPHKKPLTDADKAAGWTATPLYTHPPAAPTDALVEKVARLGHTCGDLIQHIDWLTSGLPKMLEDAALTDEEGLIGAAIDAANSARAALAAMQEAGR